MTRSAVTKLFQADVIGAPLVMAHPDRWARRAMCRFVSSLVLMIVCGCAHRSQHLTLTHEIRVPKEWRGGATGPVFQDSSDIYRYTSAYERGWWWCVVLRSKDIDCKPQCSDYFISGWPAATYGWPAGVAAADKRIDELVRVHGRSRVVEFLSEFRDVELE